jgi:hypothetical protein
MLRTKPGRPPLVGPQADNASRGYRCGRPQVMGRSLPYCYIKYS